VEWEVPVAVRGGVWSGVLCGGGGKEGDECDVQQSSKTDGLHDRDVCFLHTGDTHGRDRSDKSGPCATKESLF